MRESVIEAYLVARAQALGGEVRKVKWIGRKNAPDRVVMLPAAGVHERMPGSKRYVDQTIWVELKATGVAPEAGQVREHKRMRAVGQRVEVVDSLDRVDQILY